METTFSLQFLPSLIGGIISLGMMIFLYKFASNVLVKVLMLMIFGAFLWAGGNFLENIFVDQSLKVFWLKVEYLGLITLPVLWFILSFVYIGRGHFLKKRFIAILFLPAVIILTCFWVPGLTEFMFKKIYVDTSGSFPALELKYGPVFWFAYVHNNIYMFLGTVLLFRQMFMVQKDLGRKIMFLVLAMVIPWICTFLVVFNICPWIEVDLSPASVVISLALLSAAIYPFKSISVPISRDIILERVENGIVVIDSKNRVIDFNASFLKLTGLSKIKFSESFEKICHHINLSETLLKKIPFTREIVVEVDGEAKAFEVQASCIRSDKNKSIGTLITLKDITENKKLTDALFQSVKMESLGVLTGGIVHEFNNIMSTVSGYTELAQNASESEKVKNYLKKALVGSDLAQKLTEQLVTFSKGGAPICRAVELFPFFEQRTKLLVGKAKVKTVFKISEDLCAPWIDKGKISLVFDGIVTNAVESMPLGGELTVCAENYFLKKDSKMLANGKYVRIVFKDNGSGIDKDIILKIFDPFFSTKMHGRGLGLASCYSIVEQHGGTIEVESTGGKGSKFIVYLPVKSDE